MKIYKWEWYVDLRWVLLLKMADGNFFNWLLSNSLPKAVGRGFDYIVLVNMVQAPCLLEKDIFFRIIICWQSHIV